MFRTPRVVFAMLALFALVLASAPALALTCEFNTDWGLLTLHWNQQTGAIYGNYPHKGGTVQGQRYNDGSVQGIWRQVDGSGDFFFQMTNQGFWGNWKYAGDRNWRGSWNGKLRRCY